MKIAWITPSAFVDVDLPIVADLQKVVQIYWQVVVDGCLLHEDIMYLIFN